MVNSKSLPKNYKANISYLGTGFHGVAEQITPAGEKSIRTVVGELRQIIEMVTQKKPIINVSGRTDKGVHAREQVITFGFGEIDIDFDTSRLAHVCNKRLNPAIVVHSIIEVDPQFHARFSAKSRTYRYFIDTGIIPNIFTAPYSWHISADLNFEEINTAAKHFVGEQDFTSVCRSDESVAHNVREVFGAQFIEVFDHHQEQIAMSPERISSICKGYRFVDELGMTQLRCFEISANAFCWNMVRSIVGVLVDVGLGKMSASDVPKLLEAKNRSANKSQLAPPGGLVLWSIRY